MKELLEEVRALRIALEQLVSAKNRIALEVRISHPNLTYDSGVQSREVVVLSESELTRGVRWAWQLQCYLPQPNESEGEGYFVVAEAALNCPNDLKWGDRAIVWIDPKSCSPNTAGWCGWRKL